LAIYGATLFADRLPAELILNEFCLNNELWHSCLWASWSDLFRQLNFQVKDNIIPIEICNKCAECCKNYPFVDLTKNEIISLEKLTGLHPDIFTNPKEKIIEEYFLQFQKNGHCFFLREKNGCFACTVYEARPVICRNYPSKPGQKVACDANKEKFLTSCP